MILTGKSWLNDNIIDAAHHLLKAETNMSYIQILNLNANHWVTVSNKLGDAVSSDNTYIFDSLMPKKLTRV